MAAPYLGHRGGATGNGLTSYVQGETLRGLANPESREADRCREIIVLTINSIASGL